MTPYSSSPVGIELVEGAMMHTVAGEHLIAMPTYLVLRLTVSFIL